MINHCWSMSHDDQPFWTTTNQSIRLFCCHQPLVINYAIPNHQLLSDRSNKSYGKNQWWLGDMESDQELFITSQPTTSWLDLITIVKKDKPTFVTSVGIIPRSPQLRWAHAQCANLFRLQGVQGWNLRQPVSTWRNGRLSIQQQWWTTGGRWLTMDG